MASPSVGVSPPEWAVFEGLPESGPRGDALAAWALVLASAALLLYVALNVLLARHVLELAGPEGSMQEMQRALAEELEQGTVPGWVVAGALGMFAIFALWCGGLVCGVIAVRRPGRRGMAITALVLSGVMFLLFCGGALVGALG